MQLVYIALVTPGGTVSADVRAISYIGIPLAMVAISSQGLNPLGSGAANMAKSIGTLVGTVGTVLFYAVAMMNLVWQSFGWKDVHNGKLDKLTAVNFGWPWISHAIFSFFTYDVAHLLRCHRGYSVADCVTDGWYCHEDFVYGRRNATMCRDCDFTSTNCWSCS